MVVTIHQPDMLPWLGFFNKISKADLWVILDHTHNNPRDAAFWGRRVKMLINGHSKWISLPLNKPENGAVSMPINKMTFNLSNQKIFTDALKIIELEYKKAPYFSEIFPFIEEFFLSNEPLTGTRNLRFIFSVMKALAISTPYVFSSDLDCKESSTKLLIEILQKTKGTTYLCGGGASGYQDDNEFKENAIQLEYNNFVHPVYPQMKAENFTPGLSIVDALMNIGITETKKIVGANTKGL